MKSFTFKFSQFRLNLFLCFVCAFIMTSGTGYAQNFMMGNRPAPPGLNENQAPPAGMDSGSAYVRGISQQRDNKCPEPNDRNELDLSENQKKQIEQFRLKYGKSILPLENELAEKRAHLHTVSTGDDASLSKINKVIDEMGDIQTRLMKLHAAMQQDIRKVLNEEQRQKMDLRFLPGPPMGPRMQHLPHQRG